MATAEKKSSTRNIDAIELTLCHMLANVRMPSSYSEAFQNIYQRGQRKLSSLNSISRKIIANTFEHDFNAPTQSFVGIARIWMIRYMRQYLIEYPGFGRDRHNISEGGLWQHIVDSFRKLYEKNLANRTQSSPDEPVIDLCSDDENYDTASSVSSYGSVTRSTAERRSANAAADVTIIVSTAKKDAQKMLSGELHLEDILNDPDHMLTLSSVKYQQIYSIKLRRSGPSSIHYRFDNSAANFAALTVDRISIQQLLQTPSIGMQLDLGKIACWRFIRPNYQRHIVIGSDDPLHIDCTANEMRTRYHSVASTAAAPPLRLSKQVYKTYLNLMVHCLTAVKLDVSDSRIADLKYLLELLIGELDHMPQLHLRRHYCRYQFASQFVRVFGQEDDAAAATVDPADAVCVRETINPELEFRVEWCPFVCDTADAGAWARELHEYFERILNHRTKRALTDLRKTFAMCMRFECTECARRFTGAGALDAVKEHVRLWHAWGRFGNGRWQCVQCAWQSTDTATPSGSRFEHRCPVPVATETQDSVV